MSFFYLTPVKGDLPAHLMEVIVVNRITHLKKMFSEEPPSYNEYVVEGSVYDIVGHFILCIITNLCRNREFSTFVLKTELELFKRRLSSLTAYEMRSFSKKMLRNIKKYDSVPVYINSLQVLCQHLMLKDIAQHICSKHATDCTVHNISMKFNQCISLVAKRQVELRNGVAAIPCGRWKQFLVSIFKDHLINRISHSDLSPLRSDPRIMELLNKVKKQYVVSNEKAGVLLSKDIDSVSQFFPPCMLNLHRNLRQRHRLSHTQRFYYSLFLKDIGVPVDEAIDFWREEYRQHPNGKHSCCHNWEKDEKKYMYGIRHMYGLEGGRKSYFSANCQRIQSEDNACSEGGCPFKSFDSRNMVALLNNCTDPLLSQINELKTKGLFTNACMLFMQNCFLTPTSCDSDSFNFTPVRYYMLASNKNEMVL